MKKNDVYEGHVVEIKRLAEEIKDLLKDEEKADAFHNASAQVAGALQILEHTLSTLTRSGHEANIDRLSLSMETKNVLLSGINGFRKETTVDRKIKNIVTLEDAVAVIEQMAAAAKIGLELREIKTNQIDDLAAKKREIKTLLHSEAMKIALKIDAEEIDKIFDDALKAMVENVEMSMRGKMKCESILKRARKKIKLLLHGQLTQQEPENDG